MKLPNKKQVLQAVTGTGALLAALGTLPVASEQLPLPPHWRPYIVSVGFFALMSRQWLGILTDLFDNGQADGSFKMDGKDD